MRSLQLTSWSFCLLSMSLAMSLAMGCSSDNEEAPLGGDDAGVGGAEGGVGGTGGTSGMGGTGGVGGTGATGGTGAVGGTGGSMPDADVDAEPDAAPDAEPDAEPDVVKPDTCDAEGFTAENTRVEMFVDQKDEDVWVYTGITGGSPFEVLRVEVWESYGAPLVPGTYTIDAVEASYETCAVCFIHSTNCTKANNQTSCEKVFMPFPGSTYTINSLGSQVGDTFSLTIDDMAFREVTIDDKFVTTPVSGGTTWCMEGAQTTSEIVAPGFVDLPKPTGLSCEYPDPPYHFMGPEVGATTPEPGTVPPMQWPGAYHGGHEVGFDLAQFRCDNPHIKTLFIIVGAGWCPSCKSFMEKDVCPAGGLEEQLHARNAELLYVWGEGSQPGTAVTNSAANNRINSYGCEGGYRISDVDNNAESRVIYYSPMFSAIPWAAAIRMEDMKLTHEQPETANWMDFIAIAEANNQ